ncbi:MAG: S24/S26 family peptidase [Prevotellaceae bacterium]|nr:S24/S26 family peptidase [Prevotellaceae bacterium]
MSRLLMHNDTFLPQVVDLIEEGHEVTLLARGNSMRPFIEDGRDKLIFGKADALSIGDVVLAELTDGVFVCHRIEKIDNGIITMRGDGNVEGTETFGRERVRAKLIKIRRLGKTYDLSTSRTWKIYSAMWPRLLPIRKYLLSLYRLLWRHQLPAKWK